MLRYLQVAGAAMLFIACSSDEAAEPEAQNNASETGAIDVSGGSQQVLYDDVDLPEPGDSTEAARWIEEAFKARAVNRLVDAAKHLEQALAADPANEQALYLHGDLLLHPGAVKNASKALESFRTLQALNPQHPLAIFGEARARCQLEDDAKAKELFAQFQQQMPRAGFTLSSRDQANLHRSLGQIHYRAEEHEQAVAQFDKAVEANPADRRSLYWKALSLEQSGKLEEAYQALTDSLELKADEGRVLFARARILRRLGRDEDAKRDTRIQEILARFEDDFTANFRNNFEERIQLRKELLEIYPEFDRGRHLLALEYIAAGQGEQAESLMKEVLSEDPEDAYASFLLAQGLAASGRVEEARTLAEELLAAGTILPPVHKDLLNRIDKIAQQ